MEQVQPHSFQPRLSLFQMMKLVVFGAIASTCIAPAYRLAEIGVGTWSTWLILEGVSVPLVLALAAFPLVRKGPFKDWLIRVSLIVSVAVALGFAVYLLIFFSWGWASRRMPPEFTFLAIDAGVIIVLGFALALLARSIIPLSCPDCSRRTLILDAKAAASQVDSPGKSYLCLCCQEHFYNPNGSWRVVRPNLEPTRP